MTEAHALVKAMCGYCHKTDGCDICNFDVVGYSHGCSECDRLLRDLIDTAEEI